MAKKTPDLSNTGLGDIDQIMHNQGVSDLSWLAVDEKEYQEYAAVPRQNLDIIPELSHALRNEDDIPHVIPLRPHVMVNQNPLRHSSEPQKDMVTPIRNRVARLLMAGASPSVIEKNIRLEFDPASIRNASSAIQEVMAERGLLGNVYINASHFPNAHLDSSDKKFISKYCQSAVYVIGGCNGKNGCNCHKTGICNTFGGKYVTNEIPWDSKLVGRYSSKLAAEKRGIDTDTPGSADDWKRRIQQAFLTTPTIRNPDGVKVVMTQQPKAKVSITKEEVDSFWDRKFVSSQPKKFISASYKKFAKRMMNGHDDVVMLAASGDSDLLDLASQYGILGHTYVDIDAFDNCKQALQFMQNIMSSGSNVAPTYAVRRESSCSHCLNASDGPCAQICKISTIVNDVPPIGRKEFIESLERAVLQGRISSDMAVTAAHNSQKLQSVKWSKLTAQVNLKPVDSEPKKVYSSGNITAYYGSRPTESIPAVDADKVRRTISHAMNMGYSGKLLQNIILSAYSKEQLVQVPEIGRQAAKNEKIQGHYFIDPTAYSDYGRGCETGSKHFRKRGAPYVLASSGCAGCSLQTAPGWCSKYAKNMIRQVPSEVIARVASSKVKLPVVQEPVDNPVDKYGLSHEMHLDIRGAKTKNIDITIANPSLDD